MYVKALVKFDDVKAGVTRNVGDEFVVSKTRFAECNRICQEKIGKPALKELSK